MTSHYAEQTIAFVGVGTMSEAIVRSMLENKYDPKNIVLTHRRPERRAELEALGVVVLEDNAEAVRRATVVLLSVRPQEMDDLLSGLVSEMKPDTVLISIAAGLDVPWLTARVPDGVHVVRATPPPTAWIREGVTLLSASGDLPGATRSLMESMFENTAREIQWISDEHHDAATSVALATTPYLCLVAKALHDAGLELGLSDPELSKLLATSIDAAGRMIGHGEWSPDEIISMVATREGLTWAALNTMVERGVPSGIRAGARAMQARSVEMRGESLPYELAGYQR